jgi:hypothetical protein
MANLKASSDAPPVLSSSVKIAPVKKKKKKLNQAFSRKL